MIILLWLLSGLIPYATYLYFGEYRSWLTDEFTIGLCIRRLPIILTGPIGTLAFIFCGLSMLTIWLIDKAEQYVLVDRERRFKNDYKA